jgi:mRNA interferase MazF
VTCDAWDVVVVPFPFTEARGTKRRPALAISQRTFNQNGHTVFAMITTRAHHPWPGDSELQDRAAAGLKLPCIVRLKAFTLDNRLIIKRIGHLSSPDRRRVVGRFKQFLF